MASVSEHIEAFWLTLGRELEELGHQVAFAAGDEMDDHRYTRIVGLSRRPHIQNLIAARNLRRWTDENWLDLVVTNTATSSTLVRLSHLNAPVIYFAHGFHWDSESGPSYKIWSAIESALLPKTDGLLVLNQEDYGWAARRGYSGPISRLEYGVGLPLEKFTPSPIPSTKTAVWIGEFSQRKRPELAIKTAALIVRAVPGFRLVMLGKGALHNKAQQLAAQLGLSNVISFPGHVEPGPYITDATLLLHSATWEGLPRVVLEALAVGRPVVGPDVKGLRNIPGVVTSHSDAPEDLAATAQQVLNNPHSITIDRHLLGVEYAANQIEQFAELVIDR
ncbi:glycosyltransferase [Dietzia sp. UCD-THP]|uniref:glycosyltransferase n=1 Tax=Dietzia sp. UCD-THP TaxID=1292020 RepID=UPI001267D980|nr:glycosyltransferase [Dietzia sp. UCD-THP]